MPIVEKEINELHNSVTRPVALAAVRHVMQLTGTPQGTPTLYLSDAGAAPLEGSTVEGSKNPTRFATHNKVFIEVTDELVPEDNLTRYSNQSEQRLIFTDPKLKLKLFPVYAKARMTISLTFRSEDRGTAQRWKNGIVRKLSQGMRYHSHELKYHYIIPNDALAIIVECYNKREAQFGYGDTLQEYIRTHMTERATTLVTAAGTGARLAINEHQINVMGAFEFDNPPIEEKGESGAVYTAQVEYVLDYDRPISVITRYPLSVHSQVIDERFWPKPPEPYTIRYSQAGRTHSLSHLQRLAIRHSPHNHNPAVEGIVYPPADDWYPSRQYNKCEYLGRFIVVPTLERRHLANLRDLGDATLDPAVCSYLQRWPTYAKIHKESAVFIRVYEDDQELNHEEFALTNDLDVVLTFNPDHRKVYHLTISILRDLTLLSPAAKDRTLGDPPYVRAITGRIPDVDSGGNVTIGWWVDYTRPGATRDLDRRTVSEYQIITHRRGQLK